MEYSGKKYQEDENLREKMIFDLGTHIKQLIDKQHEVILFVNTNEPHIYCSGINKLIKRIFEELCRYILKSFVDIYFFHVYMHNIPRMKISIDERTVNSFFLLRCQSFHRKKTCQLIRIFILVTRYYNCY